MSVLCPKCSEGISRKVAREGVLFKCPGCSTELKLEFDESSFRHIFWILPPFIDGLFLLVYELFFRGRPDAVYATPGEILRADGFRGDDTKAIGNSHEDLKHFADLGDAVSQYKIGKAYLEGSGVQQDDKQALEWFLKAAHQGHVDAQSQSGRMYFMGEGTPRNNEEAFFWYSLAVKGGKPQKWADSVGRYLKQDQVSGIAKRASEWKPQK